MQENASNEGGKQAPVAKGHMLIALTPLPKEIPGSLAERLQQTHAVALVRLGGDRFLQRL